jgi:hypothetical protein
MDEIARGCLEGVLQSRVLSVPASAGGPQRAVGFVDEQNQALINFAAAN